MYQGMGQNIGWLLPEKLIFLIKHQQSTESHTDIRSTLTTLTRMFVKK